MPERVIHRYLCNIDHSSIVDLAAMAIINAIPLRLIKEQLKALRANKHNDYCSRDGVELRKIHKEMLAHLERHSKGEDDMPDQYMYNCALKRDTYLDGTIRQENVNSGHEQRNINPPYIPNGSFHGSDFTHSTISLREFSAEPMTINEVYMATNSTIHIETARGTIDVTNKEEGVEINDHAGQIIPN